MIDDRRTASVSSPAAAKDDAVLSEAALHREGVRRDHVRPDRTALQLNAPLANVYDRATVTVMRQVARATHGEAVSEIARQRRRRSGQSDVSRSSQSPLTYVSAEHAERARIDASRCASTACSGSEVPSLYETRRQRARLSSRQDDEATTTVQFGDGVRARACPRGQDNVRAGYRKGIGAGGTVHGRAVEPRCLAVRSASRPSTIRWPRAAAQDPRSARDARRNAPLTMLTLDRAVSLQDYTDFARSFRRHREGAGHLDWTAGGARRIRDGRRPEWRRDHLRKRLRSRT